MSTVRQKFGNIIQTAEEPLKLCLITDFIWEFINEFKASLYYLIGSMLDLIA